MMAKRINSSRVKIHRNYLVSDVAELLGVHKNTVRSWIGKGLPVCDAGKPTLILGSELKDYLKKTRSDKQSRCGDWELYCLRCRKPRKPYGGMLDYEPLTANNGRLKGLCEVCEGGINRYASFASLGRLQEKLEVSVPTAILHITDSNQLPLNSDLT